MHRFKNHNTARNGFNDLGVGILKVEITIMICGVWNESMFVVALRYSANEEADMIGSVALRID